jgi:hypothetical protein
MIKITIRKKPISKGRSSLYLDYYGLLSSGVIDGKKIRTETLRLYYINNPQTPTQRLEKYNRYGTLNPVQKEELDVFEAGNGNFYDFAARILKRICKRKD